MCVNLYRIYNKRALSSFMRSSLQKWKESSLIDANQDRGDEQTTDKQTLDRTDKNPTCTQLRCLSTFLPFRLQGNQ